MSGRAKRSLYYLTLVILAIITLGSTAGLAFYGGTNLSEQITNCIIVFVVFCVLYFVLPLNVLVHELGHLIFGMFAGLRFVSVSLSFFRISRRKIRFIGFRSYAGKTEMLPRSEKNAQKKFGCFALGGLLFNFVYAIVTIILFFTLRLSPMLLFWALFAPLNFFEGVMALFPAELPAGKTDGAVAIGLFKNKPDESVMLSVLLAQSMLFKKTYRDIPKNLIFDVPVIREDSPVFLALTQIRWQYLYYTDDKTGAKRELKRLEELIEFLPDDERLADAACDLAYSAKVLSRDNESAEKFLSMTSKAKGTLPYLRAQCAVTKEGKEDLLHAIKEEKMKGVKAFEQLLAEPLK